MSCNRCNVTPCRCAAPCVPCTSIPGSTLVPQPYYAGAKVCKEDHTQNIYYQQFSLGIQIQSSWNIPVCGGAAILSVPGVYAVSVGSYIWHETFGYFAINSFDPIAQTISVTNPCFADNAAPGTEVPACTTFSVGPPPCCEDVGQTGVFVKYDFTAPDDGDCIDITLTSVEGLIAGNNVQIGSGIYKLDEIKANDIVTICNEGEGITPGTPVIAQNVSGQYQYPVIQLSINPCTQPTVTSGSLVVCSEGNQTTITGNEGELFVLENATTGEGSFQTITEIIDNACVPQIVYSDISLDNTLTSGAIVFDANGYAEIQISNDLKTVDFTGSCQVAVKAHVSVVMQPDVVFTGGYGALYHEIEFVWNTDFVPTTRTCGKVVIMQNSADDKTILGFPVGAFPATFTQLAPPASLSNVYYQFDVDALCITQPGTLQSKLEMYYRILQGDNLALMTVNPTRFLVSGWIEVTKTGQ